ncbi:hypothetical protein QSJ18_19190 [Gordonia sp. ABSL1-1]|uniref:hypothetical protein n=1 Tax=Gordonia sp. ABSL1-1 TaxID=3053923 RepID=UPI00257452DD|nr:hypothetical protein [Gordonia sp. ABSL1-1]MDL9938877.1 hypothetical protein [Gordonia sp. ABSL1-1]
MTRPSGPITSPLGPIPGSIPGRLRLDQALRTDWQAREQDSAVALLDTLTDRLDTAEEYRRDGWRELAKLVEQGADADDIADAAKRNLDGVEEADGEVRHACDFEHNWVEAHGWDRFCETVAKRPDLLDRLAALGISGPTA